MLLVLPATQAEDSCCKLMKTIAVNHNEAYNNYREVYGIYSKDETQGGEWNGRPTFVSLFAQGGYTIWFDSELYSWVLGKTYDYEILLFDNSDNGGQYECPDDMPQFNWRYWQENLYLSRPAHNGFTIGCISDFGREIE